jgi:predicted RNA-binding protein with PIN domain
MTLLIDGYNLLNVTDLFGNASGSETALHASRQALLGFLATVLVAKTRAETTIVFDAAGAPPGLPRTITYEGMTAHFARRHSNADEMLEELIEAERAPRSLVVVSSDHRVQRAARRRGATYVDSERWYAERLAESRHRDKAAGEAAKPTQSLSSEQVDYWVQRFAEPAAKDEPENPFPPGYGEDLLK